MDLLHRTWVSRAMTDLGWQENQHPLNKSPELSGSHARHNQKQHKMPAIEDRLTKALTQIAEYYEKKCLGIIKWNPLSGSCTATSPLKKMSISISK